MAVDVAIEDDTAEVDEVEVDVVDADETEEVVVDEVEVEVVAEADVEVDEDASARHFSSSAMRSMTLRGTQPCAGMPSFPGCSFGISLHGMSIPENRVCRSIPTRWRYILKQLNPFNCARR